MQYHVYIRVVKFDNNAERVYGYQNKQIQACVVDLLLEGYGKHFEMQRLPVSQKMDIIIMVKVTFICC